MTFTHDELSQIAHDLTVAANQYDQDALRVADLDSRLAFTFRE